jgi:hypothetical protein
LEPQTGQSLFADNPDFSKVHIEALNVSILFVSNLPFPIIYFIASVAWIVPSIPAIEPSTPAWEQEGTAFLGGAYPKTQR